MMNNAIKYAIGSTILAGSIAISAPVMATAVDDPGPCPTGTYEVVLPGSDFEDGVWITAEGIVYGVAAEEDECWAPTEKVHTHAGYVIDRLTAGR